MLARRLTCLFAATLLVGFTSVATAQQGLPDNAMLSSMGLSGIQVMSDSESLSIRGRGYGGYGGHHYDIPKRPSAQAYGGSYAKVAGYGAKAGSFNGYNAEGYNYAYGANGSIAGLIIYKHKGGKKGGKGWSGKPRGTDGPPNGGGGYPNGGGPRPPKGKPKVKAVVAFAGGFSFSHAN